MAKEYVGYLVSWTERERGWGQRDDGYSLHESSEDFKKYEKEHWAWYEKEYGHETPDEYSSPDSSPKLVTITEEASKLLKESKQEERNGLRFFKNDFSKYVKQESGK